MDTTLAATYAVALCDYPELPAAERIAAELRYCRALEKQVGAPDDIAHLMRAVERAAHDDVEPSAEARQLTTQWLLANRVAREAALRGLGEAPEAWFDVRRG